MNRKPGVHSKPITCIERESTSPVYRLCRLTVAKFDRPAERRLPQRLLSPFGGLASFTLVQASVRADSPHTRKPLRASRPLWLAPLGVFTPRPMPRRRYLSAPLFPPSGAARAKLETSGVGGV